MKYKELTALKGEQVMLTCTVCVGGDSRGEEYFYLRAHEEVVMIDPDETNLLDLIEPVTPEIRKRRIRQRVKSLKKDLKQLEAQL